MSENSVPCKKCGCLIHFSDNNVSRTGIPIPMNFTDNKFGARGTNHNCRPQYAAPDPSKTDMHVFCPSCLTYHDRRIHPWCPTCFKLKCLNCGNIWIPTTFNMVAIGEDGEIYRECIACGHMHYEMLEDVESWRKAWNLRQELVEYLKCKNCRGKNWIGPAPLVYRRSTKSKDPDKPTTIVSVIENLPYRDYWK